MTKVIILITLLLFFVHVRSADFSFYVFACEWAGSVCKTNHCNQDDGVSEVFWNIHGLWPSDGTFNPNYCTEEKFDKSQLTSIKDGLVKYWNGLFSSADAFHAHEWTKHGSCSNMTQLQYFTTVIELAKRLDIYATLEKHGVKPGQHYDCGEVSQVMKQEFGVQNFNVTIEHGYLAAISLCVDKNLHVIDCPHRVVTQICSGNANYPDFKPGNKTKITPIDK